VTQFRDDESPGVDKSDLMEVNVDSHLGSSKLSPAADAADEALPSADPVAVAFDAVFETVSTLFSETRGVLHQLIGLEFRSGRAHDAYVEIVKSPEKVPLLIERMHRRWGAVAHVSMPKPLSGNMPGLPHPERRTLVRIEIHAGQAATAVCRVNRKTGEMFRGELVRSGAGLASQRA
jgi:hypothetical protein